MRALAAWILAFGLMVPPAVAGTGGGDEKGAAAAKTGDAATAKGSPGDTPATPPKGATPAKPEASPIESELQQLRELLDVQAKQIQLQSEQLKEEQEKMRAMEEQWKAVNTANASLHPVNEATNAGSRSGPADAAVTANYGAGQEKKEEPPTAIHIKGVTLTPGGFMVAETVWRQRALAGDVNTPFSSIPFSGQSQSKLTEFNASARQSRISMKVEGKLDSTKLTGYYETDFLPAGTTSNNNQSNSYTLRQRQFWAQAAFESGWTFTGGQMWSLATETKQGLNNLTEAAPLTIDSQYTAGFSWARQYSFRVTKAFGEKFWLGMSVEGPQTTLGGKIQNNTTLIAAPGAGGGLFNPTANYSFNETPDFVVKAAFEPGFGHYEIFGVVSSFRARLFPCGAASVANPCSVDGSMKPSAVGATNDTRAGGGIGANARWSLLNKKLDLGVHFLGGDGVGRYGTTGLADVTVRADGTLAPIHSYQSLGSIEAHPTSRLDIYAYVGGEYDGRTAYINALGQGVGYGSPLLSNAGCTTEPAPGNQNTPGSLSNCQGDTRNIIEGTLGFWYRFYKGAKGTLQFGSQYSYVTRNTWAANAGGDPHGVENMFFTSFRYYLP